MKETKKRSIIKALVYRLWQSTNMFFIALFVTGKYETAASIVGIEVVIKIVVYFWHERIWSKIKWGMINNVP